MTMQNENVLITGSNRGLGAALVDAFLTAGCEKVYAAARDPDSVAAAENIEPVRLDLNDAESVARASKVASDVSILVNNAAIVANEGVMTPSNLNRAREEMETNLWGTVEVCRAFQEVLVEQRGIILNILSIGALVSIPFAGSYCATKAALLSMTQCMRAELRPSGVAVVGVFVGPLQTEMARAGKEEGRHPVEEVAKRIVEQVASRPDYIFADATAEKVGSVYRENPWDLEKMFSK